MENQKPTLPQDPAEVVAATGTTLPSGSTSVAAQIIRKPDWLKVRAPGGEKYLEIKARLRELKLHTVCEEARCPNIGECWQGGTATIMLLGDVCTRGCRFCAVKTGKPGGVVDRDEPDKVGGLIGASGLEYVVLTSVNRDDLEDGGAGHFADTVRAIKKNKQEVLCEALVPDFQGSLAAVETLVLSGVDVYAHNVETVRRLTPRVRDRRATYDQSLRVLKAAKEISNRFFEEKRISRPMFTKTSIQVGHGETHEEILETLNDLRESLVDVVTFGQYLQPTRKHLKVADFISPLQFRIWEEKAKELGFLYVASGPLVRSSYRAGEYFMTNMLKGKTNHGV
ncbi:MAG: lipoyl synthase [Bdellovibrionota bacterium]